jgi:hypothetical protein
MRLLATRLAAIAYGRGLGDPLWDLAGVPPSLDQRFAESKSLIDAVSGQNLITFTRASGGTFVDSAGVIKTAAANVPRFTHNPVTGESLGLLVEEQRTNLLVRSEEFDQSPWGPTRATISANAETAPNGTLTADKLVEDTTAANTHQITQSVASLASGVPYTASIFLKAAERTSALAIFSGTPFGNNGQFVNLANGTLGNVVGTLDRPATIEAYPNGWYRVSITRTTTGSGTGGITVRTAVVNSSTTDGDGTSGLFLWGAQLE